MSRCIVEAGIDTEMSSICRSLTCNPSTKRPKYTIYDEQLSTKATKSATNKTTPQWFPELLTACLSFLDLVSLLTCETVSKEWKTTARSPSAWQNLYCTTWRRGDALTLPPAMDDHWRAHDWRTICLRRSRSSVELSTRAAWFVLPDQRVRVRNVGIQRSFHDGCVESLRTAHALEPLAISRVTKSKDSGVCYFEVCVRGCGSVGFVAVSEDPGSIAIGSNFHVGWVPVSYGYHGDDGRLYWNDGAADLGGLDAAYGPRWGHTRRLHSAVGPTAQDDDGDADVVGCGLELQSGQLFFTKNGSFLGYASVCADTASCRYAATVSLHHLGDSADINLGRAAFLFDIDAFIVRSGGAFSTRRD